MSEIARHQLLITLVHGTFGRGFFPQRQRRDRLPFWFEEGSPFLARLSTELGDISHKMTPLLWSGANSILVRDKTAHVLAEHLTAEHDEHPEATQLVIAHSHGGNVALRALHLLQKRAICEAGSANPLVVTLATPFIEIHQADFGRRPEQIRGVLLFLILTPSLLLPLLASILLFPSFWDMVVELDLVPMLTTIVITPIVLLSLWWIGQRATARQSQLDALKDATQVGGLMSDQRLLVIRAIDDEASLLLAFGTIVNYLTARSLSVVLFLYLLAFSILNAVFTFLGRGSIKDSHLSSAHLRKIAAPRYLRP
jgi:hypothetical protein